MYDIHCLWLMSETYDDACLSTPVWGCTAAVQHCNAAVHSAQCTVCMQSTVLWLHTMPIVHHCEQCCITLSQVSQLTKRLDWGTSCPVQLYKIKGKVRSWSKSHWCHSAICNMYCTLLTLASATLHCTRLVYTEYCYPLLSCIALCQPLLPLCCVALRLRRIFFTVLSWITLYHCCLLCCQC